MAAFHLHHFLLLPLLLLLNPYYSVRFHPPQSLPSYPFHRNIVGFTTAAATANVVSVVVDHIIVDSCFRGAIGGAAAADY